MKDEEPIGKSWPPSPTQIIFMIGGVFGTMNVAAVLDDAFRLSETIVPSDPQFGHLLIGVASLVIGSWVGWVSHGSKE